MPSRIKSFDVRLNTSAGVFSLLVEAMSHEEAKGMAIAQTEAKGHDGVTMLWCVEYPPHRRVRPGRAITD
jgi:hypothetical protein